MVRHEAAEALGSIADEASVQLLTEFVFVFVWCTGLATRKIVILTIRNDVSMRKMSQKYLHLILKAQLLMQDSDEHPMVRHEAAEALGSIADAASVQLLTEFVSCDEPIVADSCIVALDMIEFERSGGFEYADMGEE